MKILYISLILLLGMFQFTQAQQTSNYYEVYSYADYNALNVDISRDFIFFSREQYCPPCERQTPIFQNAARLNPGIRFIKIKLDPISRQNGVFRYPTLKYKGQSYIGLQEMIDIQRIIN